MSSDENPNIDTLIIQTIRSTPMGTQKQLQQYLADQGHSIDQSNISRALARIGAVKEWENGKKIYKIPPPSQIATRGELSKIAKQYKFKSEMILRMHAASMLIVLKTTPGMAMYIATRLDKLDLPGICGTIAGDDTLFIAHDDNLDYYRLTQAVDSLGY